MTLTVISLEGGLGNQLFQYAAGLRRQAVFGGDLRIETGFYPRLGRPDRQPALRHFNVDPVQAGANDLERVKDKLLEQRSDRFDERLLNTPGDIHLRGTWASERYFADHAGLIRQAFRFRNPALDAFARSSVQAVRRGSAPVVALHARRGDVMHLSNHNKYSLMRADYFASAISLFPSDSSYIVFSDTAPDLDWCASNLVFSKDAKVTFSYDMGFIVDFATISACDHVIVDFSTFSWWAAWLNPNPGKRVVAPNAIYGIGPLHACNSTDSFWPSDWTVITLPPQE